MMSSVWLRHRRAPSATSQGCLRQVHSPFSIGRFSLGALIKPSWIFPTTRRRRCRHRRPRPDHLARNASHTSILETLESWRSRDCHLLGRPHPTGDALFAYFGCRLGRERGGSSFRPLRESVVLRVDAARLRKTGCGVSQDLIGMAFQAACRLLQYPMRKKASRFKPTRPASKSDRMVTARPSLTGNERRIVNGVSPPGRAETLYA